MRTISAGLIFCIARPVVGLSLHRALDLRSLSWAAPALHLPRSPPLSRERAWVVLRGGAADGQQHGGYALSVCGRQWARYTQALDGSPMLTKMATAAVLGGVGDLIAQALEGGAAIALPRFFALAIVNIVYITPLLTIFYAANERLVGDVLRLTAESWRGACVRLAVDQLIFSPLCIAGFFYAYGLTEGLLSGADGRGLRFAICAKLQVEFRPMLISNYKVWVVPQLLNFRLVPPALRLPFASVVALIWGVVQSVIANR